MQYICFFVVLLFAVFSSASFFMAVSDDSGATLCARDPPMYSMTLENDEPLLDDSIQCAYQCVSATEPQCLGFNSLQDDVNGFNGLPRIRCHLYSAQPQIIPLSASTCVFYWVNTTICEPKSVSAQHVVNTNCSYPFTYNGALYYHCATGIVNVTSNCEPYGCFLNNRTAAVCNNPDFVASNSTVAVVINKQVTVTTTSVFGWIVILQKSLSTPSSVFNATWSDFTAGFGTYNDSFWFGLSNLYKLTTDKSYRLRIEVQQSWSGLWYSAEYWSFVVGNSSSMYTLSVAGYSGDAGDSLNYTGNGGSLNHNGMKFSTYDVNNNNNNNSNCAGASSDRGGWWYNNCSYACLTCSGTSFQWSSLPGIVQLSYARMMIKMTG